MGAGAVVQVQGGRPHAFAKAMGRGTNNQAEYHAVLLALHQAAAAGITRLTIHGDSQLILRQLDGSYQVRNAELRPLWEAARALMTRFEHVKLAWVPREENGAADAAARSAIA